MIGGLLLIELHRQMTTTGTDWLSEGQVDKAKAYEQQLMANKEVMAERFRIWAAKAVDKRNFSEASELLRKAFQANMLHPRTFSTLTYYLRRKFFNVQ
jgi:hypothetical protein